ncbi:B-cell receptor CD22-like [Oncorhynchus nerka]|uniref:B-cell receptor CD22-like n=1 Tax=Oncorhynchus nerka TaxID=8023 RepID=UPI0031B81912
MWLLKMISVMLVISLTLLGVSGSNWKVTFNDTAPCALRGSSVVFACSYAYPSDQTITNSFWYFSSQRKNNDLFLAQEYRGRVEYLGNKDNNCTLKINNLISSDATQYHFRFETVNKGGETNAWSSKTWVSLSLTGLTAKVQPATVRAGERVTLTCVTTCTPSDHPTIVWSRDGHSVSNTEFLASSEDSGRYQCAVQGQENLNSAPTSLDVKYAPRNTLVSVSPSGPVVEGSSVNLTCSSHANPAVENYTWFKKDGTDTSHTGSGEVLRLTSLTSSDSGQYFCEARNKEGAHNSTVLSLILQDTNTVQMPVYISSAATVFMVIILLVFLWMWKSPFKLCQKTAVDKKDDQNPVLFSRRTSNDPATQEARTEERENALYANIQLPPSHTHLQDSSLYSVVEPPALQNPPDPHYATFDFQQFCSSIDRAQLSGLHEDDVVYSKMKTKQAKVTDNLQYANIQFPLPSPTARSEERLEVDHSVIYSTVAKPEA